MYPQTLTDEKSEYGPEMQNENCSSTSSVPISCYLDWELKPGMFCVTRSKGKALASGGFGVKVRIQEGINNGASGGAKGSWSPKGGNSEMEKGDQIIFHQPQNVDLDEEPKNGNEDYRSLVYDYLFLEEVLCLFEQGLLECYSEDNNDQNDRDVHRPLSSPQLYALLDPLKLPMASYLVYAHLRQQTFRVMRYSSQRISLLKQLQDCPPRQKRNLLLQLRKDIQEAPPPTVLGDEVETTFTNTDEIPFSFCVYSPDSHFSKANPGVPMFLVAVTYFGQSSLTYAVLQRLLRQANGIPVKIATVADSGTVIMFGLTDYGAPVV